jgi:hypothetical protein
VRAALPPAARPRPPPRAHRPARRPARRSEVVSHRVDRAPDRAAVTNVARVTSHLCVDGDTFYAITRGVSFPSNAAFDLCVLRRDAPGGMAQVIAAVADGRCPDLAELPPPGSAAPADFEIADPALYKAVASPVRLASAIPLAAPFRCENGTRFGAAAAAAAAIDWAALALPAPGAGAEQCPEREAPGGFAQQHGVWLSPARDAALIEGGGEWGMLTWGADAALGAARGTVLGHSCLPGGGAATTSEFGRAFANGTADAGRRCDGATRRGATLELSGEAWALAEELALEADPSLPACPAGAPTPAPAAADVGTGAAASGARRAAAAGAAFALTAAALM